MERTSLANTGLHAIPEEIEETYYISYKKYSDNKVNAKGKVYDKYTNYVKELHKSSLRQKITNSTNDEPVVTLNDDLSGMLEWLRTHKDPYEEVKEKWDATRDVRLAQLRQGTSTVYEYITEYTALQLATGFQLLLSDFKKLYPEYDTRMQSRWGEFATKVLLLLCIEVSVPLANRKKWKSSIQKMTDGFIFYVKVMNDLEPNLKRVRCKAQALKTKVQLLVVAVGSTLSLCKTFVVIDKNYYRFDDIRTAIDVWFKCVHCLHAE